MEEITKDELQVVLNSFQKRQKSKPDGWAIEFFMGFYELLKDDLLQLLINQGVLEES
jgi:hypothetical protein